MNRSALIIANWQYQDAVLRSLVSPSQDAQALADVLGSPAIGGFDVKVLTNEPSWRICEETEAFFGDRDRDDLLLFYFSGHGVTDDDGQLYYAAPNTFSKRLRSTAVAASWVNEVMNGCRSRRQVLLLDCCHSGAFAHTKGGGAVNVGRYFTGNTPEEGRGKFILTASDAFQYSFEGDTVEGKPANSVFTEALVAGLRSGDADLDGDGNITLDELYTYVYRRVSERGVKQTPRKWSSDVEGSLVIASNPSPAEAPLPDDLQGAIDSFIPAARENAVPRLDRLLRGNHRGRALTALRALDTLAADDSRRVSTTARACLDAYEADAERLEKARSIKEDTERVNAQNAHAKKERERAEQQRVQAQKAAADEAAAAAEKEHISQEKIAADKAEEERLTAKYKADALARKAREFKAQRELERIEAERKQQQQAEDNRVAEEAERERIVAGEQEARARKKEKLQKDRLEARNVAAEREEAQRIENERVAREAAAERERIRQHQAAREKDEADRLAAEKADRNRAGREEFEKERVAVTKEDRPESVRSAAQQISPPRPPESETKVQSDAHPRVSPSRTRTLLALAGVVFLLFAGIYWLTQRSLTPTPGNSSGQDQPQTGSSQKVETPDQPPERIHTYALKRALVGASGEIMAVAFGPKSHLLAAGGYGTSLNIYNVATGEILRTLKHEDIMCLTFGDEGKTLASGGLDTGLHLWNAETGQSTGTLGATYQPGVAANGDSVYAIAFSPDRQWLAWGDTTQPGPGQNGLQYQVSIWNRSSAANQTVLPGREAMAMSFTPDGTRLVAVGDTGLVWWNTSTWKEQLVVPFKGRALAISPDGTLLAAGGEDKAVTLFDAATGQKQRMLTGISGKVRCLAFSSDGRILAVAGWGEVRLYKTEDWSLWQTLPHEAPAGSKGSGVNAVAFSRDGRWLATGGQDKLHLRLWEAQP